MTSAAANLLPGTWLRPYLIAAELVTASQLDALAHQPGTELWTNVVDAGLATDEAVVRMLAERFKMPVADLTRADARAASVLPEGAARKYHVVPLGLDERNIRLATADPRDIDAEQALGFITGRGTRFEVAAPSAISSRLDEIYRPENSINRLLRGLTPATVEIDAPATAGDDRDPALYAPMAKLVDAMIADAVRAGASDIHSETETTSVIVRYRLDGILREVMRVPLAAGPSLVRRVKIIAGLDVTNSMTPQDGRCTAKVDGESVDLRVATAPVARRGEKLVIRILSKSNLRASIPDLALPPEEESVLMRILQHREGMLLVTGPTGSGKTTTLYAVLNHLRTGKVNIVTVEDPVEYDVDGISQLQVNEAQGFTFSVALKSVLRQDPDIILVGEIRDAETAMIAIQAGLTGHFVFSTLHTNDSVSAIDRLGDLGVDRFKISTVLKGILAQRLLRRLCEKCAEPLPPGDVPPEGRPPAGFTGMFAPRRAPGCKACEGTGFRGRVAVLEVLPVEAAIARLIESGATRREIVDSARQFGMRTLWQSGLVRFWNGLTSFDEIRRVLSESAAAASSEDAATENTPATPEPIATPAVPHRLTVLLADDDVQMRRLLRVVLEHGGFTVVDAIDGVDALEVIATQRIDIVLLDQDMPNLNGLGVLQRLRGQIGTAMLPVIMITASAGDTETQALDLGAQDYVTKPVQPLAIVARVKAVLRRSGMT